MLAVRWLHLVGMAVALGGSVLTWSAFRRDAVADEVAASVAVGYERAFWPAMGVLVMTGVGNLGALAPYVPEPGTEWALVFAVKLGAVVALLVGSVVRTLVVHRWSRLDGHPGATNRRLRLGYAATTVALAGLVALAGVLAHG